MVIGFAAAIKIIGYLLDRYHTQTLLFFLGVIVGFLPYLWSEAKTYTKSSLRFNHYLIIILCIAIVIAGQVLGGLHQIYVSDLSMSDYMFLVASGFIASIALVLPGISGALIPLFWESMNWPQNHYHHSTCLLSFL
ncbi:DUF368 domain-containing protein [Gracilibacillus salinarum]|uniref:DUF368 domain-containing protein n=1 Tax=Gracilibacillus salinarum TaxID=2932255 RepID=A0ABY4GQ96_9BACI|nr:DUF368 domain-containing protein [Gracilibacillus salinarum]UOQ86576.1 DUF368 domain-containing protein [Gracilibacillus salinarum]